MGEYALYKGERIKIGTCEEMYYLRADQRRRVQHEPGNVDPVRDVAELRFRFPFPDEDDCEPGGDFHGQSFARSLWVPDSTITLPAGINHGTVQFRAERAGYLVSLPCPEQNPADAAAHGITITPGPAHTFGTTVNGFVIHRNGFRGRLHIIQQRWNPETRVWMLIGMCGGCTAKFRYPTFEDAAPIVEAFLNEAAKQESQSSYSATFARELARRIAAGYGRPEGTNVWPD